MDRRGVTWIEIRVKINNKDNMIVSGVVFRQPIMTDVQKHCFFTINLQMFVD